MSYKLTLEKAGAKVLEFKEFGSYQGTWLAKVEYDRETGWVQGSYGSCSGCDAFQAEFEWSEEPYYNEQDKTWELNYEVVTEEVALDAQNKYNNKLCNFGKTYLDSGLYTQEQIEKLISEDIEWDPEAEEMLKWVQNNK